VTTLVAVCLLAQVAESPPPALAAAWAAFNARRAAFGKPSFAWSARLAAAAQEGAAWAAARTARGEPFRAHFDMDGRFRRAGWADGGSEGQFGGMSEVVPGNPPIARLGFPARSAEQLARMYAEGMVYFAFRRGDMNEGHVLDYRGDWTHAGIGHAGGHFVVDYGGGEGEADEWPAGRPIPPGPAPDPGSLWARLDPPGPGAARDVTEGAIPILAFVRGLAGVRTPLRHNPGLARAAMEQAEYCAHNRVGPGTMHDRPGRSYEDRLRDAGWRPDRDAREHAALGFAAFEQAMGQWVIPDGRRQSILGATFTEVGAARCDGPYGVVRMLILGDPTSSGPVTTPALPIPDLPAAFRFDASSYVGASAAEDAAVKAARARVGAAPMTRDDRLDTLARWSYEKFRATGMAHAILLERDDRTILASGWPLTARHPPETAEPYGNYAECGASRNTLPALLAYLTAPAAGEGHREKFRWGWTHYGLYVAPEGGTCLWYGYLPGPAAARPDRGYLLLDAVDVRGADGMIGLRPRRGTAA
jgi:uncharacterized protein YkwD